MCNFIKVRQIKKSSSDRNVNQDNRFLVSSFT